VAVGGVEIAPLILFSGDLAQRICVQSFLSDSNTACNKHILETQEP